MHEHASAATHQHVSHTQSAILEKLLRLVGIRALPGPGVNACDILLRAWYSQEEDDAGSG